MEKSQQISERICTHVLFGRDGLELALTAEEYQKIAQVLTAKEAPRFIMVQGVLVNTTTINGITQSENYQDMKRINRGEWKCKYGYWHGKSEADWSCTHGRSH